MVRERVHAGGIVFNQCLVIRLQMEPPRGCQNAPLVFTTPYIVAL